MKIKKLITIVSILFTLMIVTSCFSSIENQDNIDEKAKLLEEYIEEEYIEGSYLDSKFMEENSIGQAFTEDGSIQENSFEENLYKSNSSVKDINRDTFSLELKESEFQEYMTINSDFVGEITIANTSIDFPVVKGKDNSYYLKRNFKKEKDYYGSIFMDYRNFGLGFDKNTIIYGHNMKDNKMFGTLREYMDYDFTMNHQIIVVQDLYETHRYKVFSTYFAGADGELITTSFSGNEFSEYLDMIKKNSIYDYQVDVLEESDILTLVTCSYDVDDGRYFVHAVKIDE